MRSACQRVRPCVLTVAAALAFAAAAAAGVPSGQVVADFDRTTAPVTPASGLHLTEAKGPDGNTFLRITSADAGALKGGVLFNLPRGAAPGDSSGVTVRIRAVGGGAPAHVRWLAVDEHDRVILQRRFDLPPSDAFREVSLPWTQWRWGDSTGGPPAEVRRLGFRVEQGGPTEVQLDDLRLPAGGAAEGAVDWLRRVAFRGRDLRTAEGGGCLVATDAVDSLSDADLTRILSRMRAARAVVRRLFATGLRPVEGPLPPALLIFRRQVDFVGWFESAGDEWNVRIVPPLSPGMTVQNIAAAVFDPAQGPERPVFLHESVHAVLANDVRLLSGNVQHVWLQEAVASYVQLCVYPQSVDRSELAARFRQPIDPDGRGFFKPLDQLLGKKVSPTQYAQLATLLAYVADRRPQWLPLIAKELADGRTTADALHKCGTSAAELEAEWLKWSAATLRGAADAGVMFPVPEELKAHAAK